MRGTRYYTAYSVGEENWIFSLPEKPLREAYQRYREGKVLEAAAILGRLRGLGQRYEDHHVPDGFLETHQEGWARLKDFPKGRGKEKRPLRAHLVLKPGQPPEVMVVGLEVLSGGHVEKAFPVYFHPGALHPPEAGGEVQTG